MDAAKQVNTAPFAGLRRLELDELRIAAKHVEAMLGTDGWKFLQNLLAARQHAELQVLMREPSSDRADTYALKRAHTSGLLKGLQQAYEAPHALLQIAKEELEKAQRVAEQEAHKTGEQYE